LGDRVARALMSKYSVLLGEGQVGNGYELAIDDPVTKLSRYFTISNPKRLEQRVEDIENKLSILADNTNELVFLLKGAFVPDHPNKLPSQPIEYQKNIS
jgi:hypothetical protein